MFDWNMSNHRSKIPPCKDCADREIGCHSTCKAYIEWAKEEGLKRDFVSSKRALELITMDYSIKAVEKRKEAYKSGVGKGEQNEQEEKEKPRCASETISR